MNTLNKITSPARLRALSGAIMLALSALPLNVHAQQAVKGSDVKAVDRLDNEETLRLSPFEVRGTSEEDGYLAKSTASTSRIAVDYLDLSQTVSVMTKQFISDYNIQDTRKLFEFMPNVSTGTTDQSSRLWIRGSEVNSIYIDGVIGFQRAAMPLQFYDRVELVSGPSSSAFGVGQPGGIINYTTKSPSGRPRTTLEVGVGSYNNYLANIDTEGMVESKLLGKTAYRFVGYYNEGNYLIENEFHRGAGALLSLRKDITPTLRVDTTLEYSRNTFPLSDNNLLLYQNQTSYASIMGNFGSVGNAFRPPLPNSNPYPGAAEARASNGKWVGGDLMPLGTNAYPENFGPFTTSDDFRGSIKIEKTFFDHQLTIRNTATIQNGKIFNEYVTGRAWAYLNPATGQPFAPVHPTNGFPIGTGLPFPNNVYVGTLEQFGVFPLGSRTTVAASWRAENLDIDFRKDGFLGGNWRFSLGGNINDFDNRLLLYQYNFKNSDGTLTWLPVFSSKSRTVWVNENDKNFGADTYAYSYAWGGYVNVRASYFDNRVIGEWGDRRDSSGGHTDFFNTRTRTERPLLKSNGAPRVSLSLKPLKWLSVYAVRAEHNDPSSSVPRYTLFSPGANTAGALSAINAKYNNFQDLFTYVPTGILKEYGVKMELLDGNLVASANYFQFTTSGGIVTNIINDNNPTSPTYGSVVVERSLAANAVSGGELQIAGQLTKNLGVTANYGITRGYGAPYADGSPNPIHPPTITGLHIRYGFNRWGKNFYILGGGTRYGPHLADGRQSFSVFYDKAQYFWDLGGGVSWDRGRQSVEIMQNNITKDIPFISSQIFYASGSTDQFFIKYKYKY